MTLPTIISGRYKVIRELGHGGFGVTFLAEDTHLPSQRVCVIKKLKPMEQKTNIAQLVKERFKREAVVLEELGEHPQIPQLFAYFEDNEEFYLVQEYIEGQTLEEWVRDRGVQSEIVVKQLLLDILDILVFIQTKKIIHRDLKPENIMLRSPDQKPILIDFGAVREIMGTQYLTSSGGTSSIVIGTPGFMPAEQASGRPVFASDLYALALTMIYALTGQYPQNFPHDPLTGELDWASHYDFSPGFIALLNKASHPNQRERFLTAIAMKNVLQNPVQISTSYSAPTVAIPTTQTPPLKTTLDPTQPKKSRKKSVWISLVSTLGALTLSLLIGLIARQELPQQSPSQLQKKGEPNSPISLAETKTLTPNAPPTPKDIMSPNPDFQGSAESMTELDSRQEELRQEELQKTSPELKDLAIIYAPPSNVRATPNGRILCSITNQATINIYNAEDDWFETDACGMMGVIHLSQLKWHKIEDKIIPPAIKNVGIAYVFDPPSNIRKFPNGDVLCPVERATYISIFNSTGEWFETDYCGVVGVIHFSQITFQE